MNEEVVCDHDGANGSKEYGVSALNDDNGQFG
jgi:hypothetical protein